MAPHQGARRRGASRTRIGPRGRAPRERAERSHAPRRRERARSCGTIDAARVARRKDEAVGPRPCCAPRPGRRSLGSEGSAHVADAGGDPPGAREARSLGALGRRVGPRDQVRRLPHPLPDRRRSRHSAHAKRQGLDRALRRDCEGGRGVARARGGPRRRGSRRAVGRDDRLPGASERALRRTHPRNRLLRVRRAARRGIRPPRRDARRTQAAAGCAALRRRSHGDDPLRRPRRRRRRVPPTTRASCRSRAWSPSGPSARTWAAEGATGSKRSA